MSRPSALTDILNRYKDSNLDSVEAEKAIRSLFFQDLGHSKVDVDRERRNGTPEVIFGERKSVDQIEEIAERLIGAGSNLLITRTNEEVFSRLSQTFDRLEYNETARTIRRMTEDVELGKGVVGVICAGTSDLYAAEEAVVTAEFLGSETRLISDVGVAGIHRLLDCIEEIRSFRVLVVAAGMEGALPGVVAGLVDKPVIALPTSVGYGAGFEGLAPLLTMLNSCANGISVVNIDAGFNAGYMAGMINRL